MKNRKIIFYLLLSTNAYSEGTVSEGVEGAISNQDSTINPGIPTPILPTSQTKDSSVSPGISIVPNSQSPLVKDPVMTSSSSPSTTTTSVLSAPLTNPSSAISSPSVVSTNLLSPSTSSVVSTNLLSSPSSASSAIVTSSPFGASSAQDVSSGKSTDTAQSTNSGNSSVSNPIVATSLSTTPSVGLNQNPVVPSTLSNTLSSSATFSPLGSPVSTEPKASILSSDPLKKIPDTQSIAPASTGDPKNLSPVGAALGASNPQESVNKAGAPSSALSQSDSSKTKDPEVIVPQAPEEKILKAEDSNLQKDLLKDQADQSRDLKGELPDEKKTVSTEVLPSQKEPTPTVSQNGGGSSLSLKESLPIPLPEKETVLKSPPEGNPLLKSSALPEPLTASKNISLEEESSLSPIPLPTNLLPSNEEKPSSSLESFEKALDPKKEERALKETLLNPAPSQEIIGDKKIEVVPKSLEIDLEKKIEDKKIPEIFLDTMAQEKEVSGEKIEKEKEKSQEEFLLDNPEQKFIKKKNFISNENSDQIKRILKESYGGYEAIKINELKRVMEQSLVSGYEPEISEKDREVLTQISQSDDPEDWRGILEEISQKADLNRISRPVQSSPIKRSPLVKKSSGGYDLGRYFSSRNSTSPIRFPSFSSSKSSSSMRGMTSGAGSTKNSSQISANPGSRSKLGRLIQKFGGSINRSKSSSGGVSPIFKAFWEQEKKKKLESEKAKKVSGKLSAKNPSQKIPPELAALMKGASKGGGQPNLSRQKIDSLKNLMLMSNQKNKGKEAAKVVPQGPSMSPRKSPSPESLLPELLSLIEKSQNKPIPLKNPSSLLQKREGSEKVSDKGPSFEKDSYKDLKLSSAQKFTTQKKNERPTIELNLLDNREGSLEDGLGLDKKMPPLEEDFSDFEDLD